MVVQKQLALVFGGQNTTICSAYMFFYCFLAGDMQFRKIFSPRFPKDTFFAIFFFCFDIFSLFLRNFRYTHLHFLPSCKSRKKGLKFDTCKSGDIFEAHIFLYIKNTLQFLIRCSGLIRKIKLILSSDYTLFILCHFFTFFTESI